MIRKIVFGIFYYPFLLLAVIMGVLTSLANVLPAIATVIAVIAGIIDVVQDGFYFEEFLLVIAVAFLIFVLFSIFSSIFVIVFGALTTACSTMAGIFGVLGDFDVPDTMD